MNRYTYIICAVLSFTPVLAVSPAVAALGGVANSLKIYQHDHQKLPTSWDDLIQSGALSETALKTAKKYCDIENRYHFLNPPRKIEVSGMQEMVVLMANAPGQEGNRDPVDGGDGKAEEGRFLVVVTDANKIETRRYSEAGLKRVFAESGVDLSSDTLASPPSVVGKEAGNEVQRDGRILGGPLYPAEASDENPSPKKPSDQNVPGADEAARRSTNWLPWTCFTLLVILVAGFWKIRATKSLK